jgi:hypothetical protein
MITGLHTRETLAELLGCKTWHVDWAHRAVHNRVPKPATKLGKRAFYLPEDVERMRRRWFEVTSVSGSWPQAVYRSELRNRPCCVGMSVGAPVEFGPGHIYQVVRDSPARPESERESPP